MNFILKVFKIDVSKIKTVRIYTNRKLLPFNFTDYVNKFGEFFARSGFDEITWGFLFQNFEHTGTYLFDTSSMGGEFLILFSFDELDIPIEEIGQNSVLLLGEFLRTITEMFDEISKEIKRILKQRKNFLKLGDPENYCEFYVTKDEIFASDGYHIYTDIKDAKRVIPLVINGVDFANFAKIFSEFN